MSTTTLHDAVIQDDIECVKRFISKGINLDEVDKEHGNSSLHWAVMCGHYDMVKLLLEGGANPNVMSSDGFTPTWSALDWGLSEIAELLRTYGGRVKTDSRFDRTSWSVLKAALGQPMPPEDRKKRW